MLRVFSQRELSPDNGNAVDEFDGMKRRLNKLTDSCKLQYTYLKTGFLTKLPSQCLLLPLAKLYTSAGRQPKTGLLWYLLLYKE